MFAYIFKNVNLRNVYDVLWRPSWRTRILLSVCVCGVAPPGTLFVCVLFFILGFIETKNQANKARPKWDKTK